MIDKLHQLLQRYGVDYTVEPAMHMATTFQIGNTRIVATPCADGNLKVRMADTNTKVPPEDATLKCRHTETRAAKDGERCLRCGDLVSSTLNQEGVPCKIPPCQDDIPYHVRMTC